MTLTVDLTPEEEIRLAAKARAQGVSVHVFVGNVLKQVATPPDDIPGAAKPAELPAWPGSVVGQLRREDIYEDLR